MLEANRLILDNARARRRRRAGRLPVDGRVVVERGRAPGALDACAGRRSSAPARSCATATSAPTPRSASGCVIEDAEVEHSILLAGCLGVRPRRAHGVLAARAQRARAPRRAPAARLPLHGRRQLRHLDPCEAARHRRRRDARPRRRAAPASAPATRCLARGRARSSTSPTRAAVGALRAAEEPRGDRQLRRLDRRRRRRDAPARRRSRSTRDGAGNLARAAAQAGAPLVHVSTDYVFDGEAPRDAQGRPRPYVESDPTGPRTVYGRTKLDRRARGARRLPAPHGGAHRVAVRRGRAQLRGHDAAPRRRSARRCRSSTTRSAARRGRATSRPRCSACWSAAWRARAPRRRRAGLVERLRAGDLPARPSVACRVEAVTSAAAWPARAPRPAWSALASERADVLPLPDWREGLAGYLAARDGMIRHESSRLATSSEGAHP